MKKLQTSLIILFSLALLFSETRVKIKRAEIIDCRKELTLYGTFYSKKVVPVSSRIPGIIVKMYKETFKTVRKNEPLFIVKRDAPGYKFKPKKVVSPTNGVITKISYPQGSRVQPGVPILFISEYSPIYLNVKIPYEYKDYIEDTKKVKVCIPFSKKCFSGSVSSMLLPADQKNRLISFEVKVDNKNYWIVPGMRAKIYIEYSLGKLLFIPLEALQGEGSKSYVWKIVEGKAYKTEISAGIIYEGKIEVRRGLSEGNFVVIAGQENLYNGAKVEVIK